MSKDKKSKETKKNRYADLIISDEEDDKINKLDTVNVPIVISSGIQQTVETLPVPKSTVLEPLKEIFLHKIERGEYNEKKYNENNSHIKRNIKEKEIFDQTKYDGIDCGENLYLTNYWDIYCHKKSSNDWKKDSYDHIYEIKNICDFCRFFNTFNNLDKNNYEFFVMKNKILPMWEDNSNRNGGICSILFNSSFDKRTKKDIGSEIMISICILIMNNTLLKDNNKINGISYSVKPRNTVIIKIWYDDWKFNMKEQFPFSLLEYFENKINGGVKNESVSKNISVRFGEIKPIY